MANFNLSLNLVLSNWLSDVTASYPEGFFLLSLSAAFPCTFSGFLAWLGVVCLYLVVAEDVLPPPYPVKNPHSDHSADISMIGSNSLVGHVPNRLVKI